MHREQPIQAFKATGHCPGTCWTRTEEQQGCTKRPWSRDPPQGRCHLPNRMWLDYPIPRARSPCLPKLISQGTRSCVCKFQPYLGSQALGLGLPGNQSVGVVYSHCHSKPQFPIYRSPALVLTLCELASPFRALLALSDSISSNKKDQEIHEGTEEPRTPLGWPRPDP